MNRPGVKMTLFAVLDRTRPEELRDPESVRGLLYGIAFHEGAPITEALERYIEILLEEYCPGDGVSHPP